ncbi:MAG: hypothetical protein IH989_08725 [Planctomycetes bacterium]|nr:hypothetical protein [Planctomycetota bacterium]
MPKRKSVRLKRFTDAWNALPEIDRRFVSTLVVVQHTIGEETLSYGETPRALQRSLLELDRNTVLSVIIQCLYLLLDPSVLKRAKKAHRQHAAKKRLLAVKKKSRAKSPAPKRRTAKKGSSKR